MTPAEKAPPAAVIALGRRVFRVRPQMRLVTAIEDEMEGIAQLARRFERGQWTVCELVAVVHMMIESCGTTMDYHELGDAMMAEGLSGFSGAALRFFNLVLGGTQA